MQPNGKTLSQEGAVDDTDCYQQGRSKQFTKKLSASDKADPQQELKLTGCH